MLLHDSLQRLKGNLVSAAVIAEKRSPATGSTPLPIFIEAQRDSTCAADNYDAIKATQCAAENKIGEIHYNE